MRRLPLLVLAGAAAAVGAAVVVAVTATPPGGPPSRTTVSAPPDATAGDKDAVSSTTPSGERGSEYWTPDRMRAAKPLPTPKISDEEYQRLFGSKTKPE